MSWEVVMSAVLPANHCHGSWIILYPAASFSSVLHGHQTVVQICHQNKKIPTYYLQGLGTSLLIQPLFYFPVITAALRHSQSVLCLSYPRLIRNILASIWRREQTVCFPSCLVVCKGGTKQRYYSFIVKKKRKKKIYKICSFPYL